MIRRLDLGSAVGRERVESYGSGRKLIRKLSPYRS